MNRFFKFTKWDCDLQWYEAIHELEDGERVVFYVKAKDKRDFIMLEYAEELFYAICRNAENLVKSIAFKYYPVYRERWSVGTPLSQEDFEASIFLKSIVIYGEDEKEVNWGQGGVFGEHVFCVRLDQENEILGISLDG